MSKVLLSGDIIALEFKGNIEKLHFMNYSLCGSYVLCHIFISRQKVVQKLGEGIVTLYVYFVKDSIFVFKDAKQYYLLPY